MRPVSLRVRLFALLPIGAPAALSLPVAPVVKPPALLAWPDVTNGLLATPTHRDQIGQVIVPVLINGKGPFRFLMDTGANGSVVSTALVRMLGLVPAPALNERVEGTTGTAQLPCVAIASLRIGHIVKRNLQLPVSDSPLLHGLDGILGMAGFGAVRVLIDFQGNRVAIARANSYGPQPQGFLTIPARRTPGGLLMIPGHVGDVSVTAIIDTGSEGTIGNNALRLALLRESAEKTLKTRIYGVTQQVSKGGVSVAPPIYLGPVAIQHLAIVYSSIPIFRDWNLDGGPALLVGMNVLGTVNALVLDYSRSRVDILPDSSAGQSIVVRYLYHSTLITKKDGSD